MQDIQTRILDEVALTTRDKIRNVLDNFYARLGNCQIVDGHQFEHNIN